MKNTNHHAARVAAGALLLVLASSSNAQDLFTPQLRWVHDAPTEQAWIPEEVRFAGAENHVFSSADFGARRLMLFDANGTPLNPRFVDPQPNTGHGVMHIATGRTGHALFSLVQYPDPEPTDRRTEIARHDMTQAAQGAPFAPVWTHDPGVHGNIPAQLAANADGTRVVCALFDGTQIQLDLLDGNSGELLETNFLGGAGIEGLEMSNSGDRIAVSTGSDLWVLDGSLAPVFQGPTMLPTPTIALSGDGKTLLVGQLGGLEVYRDNGVWSLLGEIEAEPTYVATRAAISDDGETVAIAWWNAASGLDLRYELRYGPALDVVWTNSEFGSPATGLQNLPVEVCLTPSGDRAAFSSWGDGDDDPEVILVDRGASLTLLAIDLPGSVRGLDLDSTGTRIVVSYKETHSNVHGVRGGIRLYDTGERDIQLRSTPEVGGQVQLSTIVPTTPAHVVFLVGPRAPAPEHYPGLGTLFVDRRAARSYAVAATSSTRVDLDIPLGTNAALHGVELAAQALIRVPGGTRFTFSVVDLLVL